MAVEKVGEKYRCNVCGNEVIVTKVGGGTLVCCGEDMQKIEQMDNYPGCLTEEGSKISITASLRVNQCITLPMVSI